MGKQFRLRELKGNRRNQKDNGHEDFRFHIFVSKSLLYEAVYLDRF